MFDDDVVEHRLEALPKMRVIIVSNQPLWREALSNLVSNQSQADVVLAATDLDSLPHAGSAVDLLVLDLPASVDPSDWLSAAEWVSASRRVLAVPDLDLALARVAYAHGFQGLLPKSASPALLTAIIELVMAGGEYFPCFDEVAETPALPGKIALEGLTKRQREVFAHMQQGRTNKEIAKSLDVSVATVKLHVQAILNAAGARNRTEAVTRLDSSRSQ
jgi:two-component system nitrate/nitrite response regulator NarL